MADSALTAAERAKLEQRRERLMKLLQDGSGTGSGETLDAEDRRDLEQEWHKIDQELNRR
jgi:50S ribosomal subunit-associated GTPase HflX